MRRTSGSTDTSDDADLFGRLRVFVDQWKSFNGTEQAGAQQFLQGLLDVYDVSFKPGTIFEQHSVRLPARGTNASQGTLFGQDHIASYTAERMDMYLPKVCVWEMKAPAEKDLSKHHGQLLGYWARVRTWDELNEAVNACYGFPSGTWRSERETLELLLGLNHHVADLQ